MQVVVRSAEQGWAVPDDINNGLSEDQLWKVSRDGVKNF